MTFRLSEEAYERLEEMAKRYGISINVLCAYVVGSWLDEKQRTSERFLQAVVEKYADDRGFAQYLENPVYRRLLTDLMREALQATVGAEAKAEAKT